MKFDRDSGIVIVIDNSAYDRLGSWCNTGCAMVGIHKGLIITTIAEVGLMTEIY